jgi:hypothetical protein
MIDNSLWCNDQVFGRADLFGFLVNLQHRIEDAQPAGDHRDLCCRPLLRVFRARLVGAARLVEIPATPDRRTVQ